MHNLVELTQAVDALLPQTQCERCDYKGCKPYAEAMVRKGEAINKCVPGGEPTMLALAKLLKREPIAVTEPAKPKMIAVIREPECIGCTKCIQACPVDAIVGASKTLHTVITDHCTGCELCLPACPVDCIDLITLPGNPPTWIVGEDNTAQLRANQARSHFNRRNARLTEEATQRAAERNKATVQVDIQAEILASLKRAKAKNTSKTHEQHHTPRDLSAL